MDIRYEELKAKVEDISLDKSSVINYRGRDYWVQPNSISFREAGKDAGKPAEWHRSSEYSGADIYIWRDIEPEFKKAMILHEIIEADLQHHQRVPGEEAHDAAMKDGMRYAGETMEWFALSVFRMLTAYMVARYDAMDSALGKAA